MNGNHDCWTPSTVADALNHTESVHQRLLERLQYIVNNYHRESFSLEYLEVVCGTWLIKFSQQVFSAWREVASGSAISAASSVPQLKTTTGAADVYDTERYHSHLCYVVNALLGGTLPSDLSVGSVSDDGIKKSASATLQDPRSSVMIRQYNQAVLRRKQQSSIVLLSPNLRCPRAQTLRLLYRWRDWLLFDNLAEYEPESYPDIDWNFRKIHAEYPSTPNDGYDSLVIAILPLYIPICLMEGFLRLRQAVLSLKLTRPEVVFSSMALTYNRDPVARMLIAEWRSEGSRLHYHQHGGGYGISANLVQENFELKVTDQFYSWGWSKPGVNIQHLSPAYPRPIRRRPSQEVLLSLADFPRRPFKIQHMPMGVQVDDMDRNTVAFVMRFKNLDKLTIDLSHEDYGRGIKESLMNVDSNIRFYRGRHGSVRYKGFGLVVLNYFGTSILETLAFNIPTVCFRDPEVYATRKEASGFVEELELAGVLHPNGESAARFVASLEGDFDAWWSSRSVQLARNNFVDRFARFAPDWADQWEERLLEASS